MVYTSQALCFEPISTTPLRKKRHSQLPLALSRRLSLALALSHRLSSAGPHVTPSWRCAGASRERAHGNHPFLPSLCLGMVFPSSYFTYTILQRDGFTGTSGLCLGKPGSTCHVLSLTFAASFLPVQLFSNHHFMKFRFTNAFLQKRGRFVCVSSTLAQDLSLYLYSRVNGHTFILNSTTNCSVTCATSHLEYGHHFLIGEKLCG